MYIRVYAPLTKRILYLKNTNNIKLWNLFSLNQSSTDKPTIFMTRVYMYPLPTLPAWGSVEPLQVRTILLICSVACLPPLLPLRVMSVICVL